MIGRQRKHQSFIGKQITVLSGLPWFEVLGTVWQIARKALQARSYKGMYEVLEYESTLELRDRSGKRATFRKREKVRYLQDRIIAYQDQAWGDGDILIDYRCTPGKAVDQYRLGHKTYILISRREVKNRRDIDEFNIKWNMRDGFLRRTEQWETHVKHPMKSLKISVVFPKSRPPQRTTLIESNRQRSHNLNEQIRKKPDGRWQITWEAHRPHLHETYILQWEW
jgi:hypothetical protein